jgi:hypothetical protein
MITNKELIRFANGNTDFYEAAFAYFCDKEQSSENKNLMHQAYLAEVENKAGVKREGLEFNAWAGHPSCKWAAMAVVNSAIRAILPVTILPQFEAFADFRTQNVGDITKFTIMPRSFYVVSKGGRSERTSFRQRKFASDVTLVPEEHIITVYRRLYNVLAGTDNIADFMTWVLASMRTSMYTEALNVLTAGLAGIPAGALNVTGAFDMKTLVKMCETVQYRNGGVRPVIAGSATALMNVLPDSTSGYRMNVPGDGDGRIELLRSILGYDVLKLDNAVDTTGNLVLPDNKIYVISPSQDKLIKGTMSVTLQNSNDYYENADLTQNFTTRLSFGFLFATSAYAGVYTING